MNSDDLLKDLVNSLIEEKRLENKNKFLRRKKYLL